MKVGCAAQRVFVDSPRQTTARSILSPTTGFIAEAGFTHSLTPARNCTFGCTYCYVPTMRIYAGLRPEDWQRWGQFTTFKSNAPELLSRELKPGQRIYCSPLVDPYQPAEAEQRLMPRILEAVIESPPRVFCLQTRGTLILRDLHLLRNIKNLRVSFSITTDRDDVRKLYEPHCATFHERLETVRALRAAGIETHATLAPLLPCDPENLARAAILATGRNLIGDPLHIHAVKPRGATTRDAAFRIAETKGQEEWLDAEFQASIVERIDREARRAGFRFETGPRGFARLAQ
jgi:DNA repair photolyase